CTILEPGPVETAVAQNSADWGKTIDHSTADQKTQKTDGDNAGRIYKTGRQK
ncbi:hypothetical protein OS493_035066, partial [Desmophyllum pertusum]